jgi:hypothetical protein
MDRGIPVSNKLLSNLWAMQAQNQHVKRVQQMKSSINFRRLEPKEYNHLQRKRKKEQLWEGS